MIKRIVLVVLAVSLLAASLTPPAYCDDALKKLGRGALNCGTFPMELYFEFCKVNDDDGLMAAVTWGVLSGLGKSAVRLIVGVYEVATFPIPVPQGYEPILTDPEFMGENFTV